MTSDLRRRRILLTGWINLNVVDGSAFFLPALAAALAGDPFTDVTLVSAVPVRREQVVAEIRDLLNVELVDPWAVVPEERRRDYQMRADWGTREGLARLLRELDVRQPADIVIVRDTALADAMVREQPEVASRLIVYVTGLTFAGEDPDDDVVAALQRLAAAGVVRFALQTDAMRERFHQLLPDVDAGRSLVLRPMVAGSAVADAQVVEDDAVPSRLIYTGKFAPGWNSRQIIAAFRAARRDDPRLSLTLVGDQIQKDPEDEGFAPDMKRLLTSSDVWWTGAVERRVSRALIRQHDVGISWRAAHMDDSLELSTKLLEYGALGRPCIINRNPMHEGIFGSDYPLYANTTAEFTELLATLPRRAQEYREAARRAHAIGSEYTYAKALERLEPTLGAIAPRDPEAAFPVREDVFAEHGFEKAFDHYAHARAVAEVAARHAALADQALTEDVSGVSPQGNDQAVVARLRKEVEAAKAKEREAEQRLAALRSSRLGSLQTRYWALRKKRRG